MSDALAHSGGHLLADHLKMVAELAAEFSKAFDPAEASKRWAYLAGLWHDLGKYREGFQRFLRYCDQANDPNAHIEGKVGGREKTHSAAGALWAREQLNRPKQMPYGNILAYLIAGHHAGLDDWHGGLSERLETEDSKLELQEAKYANPPAHLLTHGDFVPDLHAIPGGLTGLAFSLWVRMLFSCVVDADFLDTEAHFDAGKPTKRAGFPTLQAMQQAFDCHMISKAASAHATSVNALRASIRHQCREKAALPPGFFSLTVPTGGGKTDLAPEKRTA